MKIASTIAAALALLACTARSTQAQVAAGPNCSTNTLAYYISLGAGGCMFDSILYRNFTYVAPVSTTITPDQILVIPSLLPTVTAPYPGLTFNAPWSVGVDGSLSSIIGYDTVPFPPNGSANLPDGVLTLDLGTAAIGGIIGSVEVTETVTPADSTLSQELEVYDICADGCRQQKTDSASLSGLQSLTIQLKVALDGGTGGASLNSFTANESYGVQPQ